MKITLKSLISQHGERSELCLTEDSDPIKKGKNAALGFLPLFIRSKPKINNNFVNFLHTKK